MKVEVRITPQREEAALVIEAPALTPAVEELARRLRAEEEGPLLGFRDGQAIPLPLSEAVRFYAEDKGVRVQTADGAVYEVKLRLYELEERLDGHVFVRVSHSEIVNLKKVTALDLSLAGTIKLTLAGGGTCWVSWRNVRKLKEALGL